LGDFLPSPDPGWMTNLRLRAPRYSRFSVASPRWESRPGSSARCRVAAWRRRLSLRAFSASPSSGTGQGAGRHLDLHVAQQLTQLAEGVVPFAQAQIVDVVLLAPAPELVAGERFPGRLDAVPEVEQRHEVGVGVLPAAVGLVGGLALLCRAVAGVLDGEARHHDQHLAQAALLGPGQHHARQARVDGQPGQLATDGGEPPALVHRAQLEEQPEAVGDEARIRRIDEGEGLDVTELQRQHGEDHRGQVGAADLGVGERRPGEEVLLVVEADADPLGHAAAAAHALVGAGLADRLHRQALDLGPVAVAADAHQARVDHVADARHGKRGLGDVGGQHDAPPGVGREDAILLGIGEARIERQDLGAAQVGPAQGIGGLADLPLAGQEHQDVAGAMEPALVALDALDLLHRMQDALLQGAILLVLGLPHQRPVVQLHRVGAAGDLHHRRRPVGLIAPAGPGEVGGEARNIDGGRGDDHLEVGTTRQQALQVAEQEIDVEATFVGLIDDDRIKAGEVGIVARLR